MSLPSGSYTYDNNGNTKTKPDGTQYNWDFENRLTQVVLPGSGGTVNFKYDPFGRRIQKSFTQGSTTTTTNYLYDRKNLLEELDSGGNVLARYTQTRSLDQSLSELRSGITSYYEVGGLGSITSLSNASGTLANTYTYDSYGKLTASTGTITNPFQYTGREFDPETGIYEYRARYYDQSVGRFLSEDPIGFKGGNNFYAYTNNNPVRYRDPNGLLRDCDQEHIECWRKCWSQCPPWPFGPKGKGGHWRYCNAKCLAEYMECNAENDAERGAQYCSQNPATCLAIGIGLATLAAQPELAPLLPELAPALF